MNKQANGHRKPLRAESYLAPETLAQLKPFELRARMIVEGVRTGMHTSPHQGMSVEFKQHRAYSPGDDLRHLDWKVYARSDRPTIKQYEQETTLDVNILVDCSASMNFGTLGVKKGWGGTTASDTTSTWTKFDHATAIAAALSWMALQKCDRVGLHLFSDRLIQSTARQGSSDHWRQIVSLLSGQPVSSTTDFENSIKHILPNTRNRSLFIIISDFLESPNAIHSSLARFHHGRHDVICIQTLDRMEIDFDLNDPTPFRGMEGEGSVLVDPRSIQDEYIKSLEKHQSTIVESITSMGFDYLLMNTHLPVAPAVARLAARRSTWLKNHHAR